MTDAKATDSKKTRPLTPAPNAAARMQELLREQARENQGEDSAAEREPYSNTQMSKSSNQYGGGEASTPAHEPAAEEPKAAESGAALSLQDRVRARLTTKEGKEATVRLSIDVSERLHERIKVYCAKNRTTTRAVAVALLESLMDEAEE